MTKGVGGKTVKEALATLVDMSADAKPIAESEYAGRIKKAQSLMTTQGMDALYLHAGSSLYYFTGTRWRGSERMVGALLLPNGAPIYIAPHKSSLLGIISSHLSHTVNGARDGVHCFR